MATTTVRCLILYIQSVFTKDARLEDLQNRLCKNIGQSVSLSMQRDRALLHLLNYDLLPPIGEMLSLPCCCGLSTLGPCETSSILCPAPPLLHPFLFQLLDYKDRDTVLTKARTNVHLLVNNAHILLFPDFSAGVQRQLAKFTDIKKRLRTLGVQYYMLYPTKPPRSLQQ